MGALDNRMTEGAKDNLAYQEKRKIEDMNNKLKLENRVKNAIFSRNNFEAPANQKLIAENALKRPEGDNRFSNFVRGFRREHTDFFANTKRHSAVFDQHSTPTKNISPQKMQRSSAIFQRKLPKGEPILTDFVAKRENSLGKKPQATERAQELPVRMRQTAANNNLDLRLRREKTESVIFVSRNQNLQHFNPSAQLQVNSRNQGKAFLIASVWIHF